MQATPSGVATRPGLITGLFIGVLSLPILTLLRLSGAAGLGALCLLMALVAYAVAGYLASRRSGLVRSGVGAGALAAAITLFIAICLGIVILALLQPRLALGLPATASGALRGPAGRALLARRATLFGFTVVASLFTMGIGLLGGFLGGLLGRLSHPRPALAAPIAAPFTPRYQAPPQYAPNPTPVAPVAPVAPGAPFAPPPPAPAPAPSYPTDPGPPPYYQPSSYAEADTPTVADRDPAE